MFGSTAFDSATSGRSKNIQKELECVRCACAACVCVCQKLMCLMAFSIECSATFGAGLKRTTIYPACDIVGLADRSNDSSVLHKIRYDRFDQIQRVQKNPNGLKFTFDS